MQSKTRHKSSSDRAASFRLTLFISTFILAWIGAMLVIAVIAMLNDINWSRPFLERELNSALDRKSTLGHLKWGYGLNGFSVWTDHLVLREADGTPFLEAGKSEMGVSLPSLLRRDPVINFLAFEKPVVRLVKTAPNAWNFDDLMKPGPQIKLVQMKNGIVHLIDRTESPTDLEPLALSGVQMKLNLPHKGNTQPFLFSFELPRKKYSSTFNLEGLGTGELDKWKGNNYIFEVNGNDLNPRDVERLTSFFTASTADREESEVERPGTSGGAAASPAAKAEDPAARTGSQSPAAQQALGGLLSLMHPVNGLFNIAIKGEGTFDREIKANIQTTVEGLTIDNSRFGEIKAGSANSSFTASLSKDKLAWTNLLLKLKGMELRSTGILDRWQNPAPLVKGELTGKVPDIGVLQELFKQEPSAGHKKSGLTGMGGDLAPARLVGKAEIKVSFEGTTDDTKVVTLVKTRDVAIKEMLNKANSQFPLLCVVGLSSQANIKGDLRIDNQNRIEINDVQITGPGTNLRANGWVDLESNKSRLVLKGERISLSQTGLGLSSNDKTYRQVTGSIKLPGKNSFSLSGSATADATIETSGSAYSLNGDIGLNDASFALKNNDLTVNQVNGKVHLSQNSKGGTMIFKDIKGKMGEGKFELDGKLSINRSSQVNVALHATSLDLKHLSALMSLFQIKMPILTEHQLYGDVKDVVIKISGSPNNPNIYFSAVPEHLFYKPPGLAKPVRADAGSIVYDRDQLNLHDVQIVSNGKTIVTSMMIDRVSRDCLLKRVKAKTDNIELADIHYYLSSTAMPPPMRKAYLEFLDTYKISRMRGRAYADILCQINSPDDIKFDGTFGLHNAAATIFGYPVSKMEGVFAAAGDDLLLQNLSGYLRGSRFMLDGSINQYRSNRPSWRTQLSATLAPRELVQLIPSLTESIKSSRIEIKSQGPLFLRATVEGDAESNRVQYSLTSNANNRMVLTGNFGKLHQPPGTIVTVDGVVTANQLGISLTDTHVLMAETFVELEGLVTYAVKGKNGLPDMPARVRLSIDVPQKAPVKVLLAVIDPPLAKDMDGTIGGSLTIDGDIDRPVMVSDLTFVGITEKTLGISQMNGRLKGGGTMTMANRESTADDSNKLTFNPAPSVIEIDSVFIQKLPVTDLKANVLLSPSGKDRAGPSIVIEDGQGRIADGNMTFKAEFNPEDRSIRAKATVKKVSAARITDELMGQPNEISGTGSSVIEIRTRGDEMQDLIKNLQGHGEIIVEEGEIARFGHLQNRITQYNLITQGIFGFNLNNLVQSVWPVRSGEFNLIKNHFAIEQGVIRFDEIRFNGDDMRLWGAGEADLVTNKITLDMAGKIPRVANSRLSGSLGSVSRNLTLQKAMKMVTFGKLESLPALPVLGDIASDKPRTFTFSVDSTMEDAKLIARSIEKSFKWLPNKPDATAHPVPALQHGVH